MIVYTHGSPGKPPTGTHTIFVAPAAMMPGHAVPDDWWDYAADKRKPREFAVTFVRGEAEVEDRLGRFLLEHEMAMKTRLVLAPEW